MVSRAASRGPPIYADWAEPRLMIAHRSKPGCHCSPGCHRSTRGPCQPSARASWLPVHSPTLGCLAASPPGGQVPQNVQSQIGPVFAHAFSSSSYSCDFSQTAGCLGSSIFGSLIRIFVMLPTLLAHSHPLCNSGFVWYKQQLLRSLQPPRLPLC
jgi:hypothetical protein